MRFDPNPTIDDDSFLALFLACRLRGRVFTDAFTSVRPETLSKAVEMAWGEHYNMDIPYLMLLIRL